MIRLIVFCLLVNLCSVTHASRWGLLTLPQKNELAEYRSVWHLLTSEQQQILETGAFRIAKANSDTRNFFQEEYKKWLSLSPEDRRELKMRWGLYKQLSSEERQRIRIGLAHLKKLPREKQESIRYLLREAGEQ